MRKCILALVVLCAFWSKGVCAVTITVTGSFNNLEPLTSYNYSVTASGLPPGAGAIEFTWGFVGKDDDANPTYGAGNATVSGVKWKNSSNTDDPKKITKVKVRNHPHRPHYHHT